MAEEDARQGRDEAADELLNQAGVVVDDEFDDMIVSDGPGPRYTVGELRRWKEDPEQLEQHIGAAEQLQELEEISHRTAVTLAKLVDAVSVKPFRVPNAAALFSDRFGKAFKVPIVRPMNFAGFFPMPRLGARLVNLGKVPFRMPSVAALLGPDFAKPFPVINLGAGLANVSRVSFPIPTAAALLGSDGSGKWFAARRESLRRSRLPTNLRSLPAWTSEEVLDFTLEHGISLYLVPRATVAERLLEARDGASVRRVLGDRRQEIVADCKVVLEACDQLSTLGLRQMALQAVAALEVDLYAPAQALAGNLLDSLRRTHLDPYLARVANRKVGETPQDVKSRLEDLEAWQSYVASALWSTFQHYFQSQGDAIPHAFSRHATAHAAGSRQYSRRSAVQGLIAVTSAIGYLNGLS